MHANEDERVVYVEDLKDLLKTLFIVGGRGYMPGIYTMISRTTPLYTLSAYTKPYHLQRLSVLSLQ